MSRLILGVDAGNYASKVAGPYGVLTGRSSMCEWFEKDFDEDYGMGDDMEFEINGRKGFMGTLASYEDQFGGGSLYGGTKAHDDVQVRVLLSVYRYMRDNCPGVSNVSLVAGQPVNSHKESEKKKIIKMLKGHHDFVVNGEGVSFTIDDVAIVAEGSGAFWSNPQMGQQRIIDVGSGTVNCVTIIDKRQNNNASGTFNYGMETINKNTGIGGIARGIINSATELRWERSDNVTICGAAANELLPYIAKHFEGVETVLPRLHVFDGVKILGPEFANAVGFYDMARNAFK